VEIKKKKKSRILEKEVKCTRKLPRVIAIKIEKSDEFNVEALALYLTAKVELDQFFLGGVEAKAGHDHIMLMIIINYSGLVVAGAIVVAHIVRGCCNCHKLSTPIQGNNEVLL